MLGKQDRSGDALMCCFRPGQQLCVIRKSAIQLCCEIGVEDHK